MTIVEIHYVDHGVQGEYGFFGKTVAKSEVAGMTATEIEAEKAEMIAELGDHISAVEVELVGAVA